jgi:hypothetical protein
METWTQTASYLYRLDLAPNSYLEIFSENAGVTWHCIFANHGEALALFFGEASVEDAKAQAAVVLRAFGSIAAKAYDREYSYNEKV